MSLCAIALVGCSAPARPGEAAREALAAHADASPSSFDINNLISDADVRGGASITVAEVQAFLASKHSFLAGYTDPAFGQTAAALIVGQSLAQGISPLYMLARIQTESSLVESGSSSYLDAATGCGCPDGGGCNQSYAGFGKQIECGAKLIHNYFVALDAGQPTVAGWSVGQPKSTSDPCTVTPANKATAALYTYTPWVGAYGIGCGRGDVGGSSLVALLYARYQSQQGWGGGPVDPCAGLVDGSYCGGDGLSGQMGTLYACKGGQAASSTACAGGCKWNPPGTPDACDPTPPAGGGGGGAKPAPGASAPPPSTFSHDREPAPTSDGPATASGCSMSGRAAGRAPATLGLALLLLGLALRRGG